MGKEREKGSSNHTHTIHSIHIQPQGQGGVYTTNTNERKTRNTKTRTQTDRKERMSLMTLFAGPTTMHPTHLDRSLHDLMFAPTSCRSRCGSGSLARRAGGGARMDVIEHSDKYDLVVDAPGLTPADIHVKLEDGVLSIEGKHEVHETKEDSGGTVIYSERRRSSFSRRFALPDDADESSIHAKQKDGVVTISISMMATLHMPMLEDEACISLIDRFRTLHSGTLLMKPTNQYKTTPYDMDIVHTKHESMMQTL